MATAERLDASVVALIGLVALAGGLAGLLQPAASTPCFGSDRPLGDIGNGELAC